MWYGAHSEIVNVIARQAELNRTLHVLVIYLFIYSFTCSFIHSSNTRKCYLQQRVVQNIKERRGVFAQQSACVHATFRHQ